MDYLHPTPLLLNCNYSSLLMSLNNLSFCLSSTYYYNLNLQVRVKIYKLNWKFTSEIICLLNLSHLRARDTRKYSFYSSPSILFFKMERRYSEVDSNDSRQMGQILISCRTGCFPVSIVPFKIKLSNK